MKINFCKYQGTGNDFVMIDNRASVFNGKDTGKIRLLCDRKFGIGADGLILLQNKEGFDFEMVYFNADGNESSMCGNGGRCTVKFAEYLGIVKDNTTFLAIDGPHDAKLADDWVSLKMIDVKTVREDSGNYVLNTGSPHFVTFVEDLKNLHVFEEGKKIRYSVPFKKEGINVNFAGNSKNEDFVSVRTYERGVEDETLSCGTGVTAVALAIHAKSGGQPGKYHQPIKTPGGMLSVDFLSDGEGGFSEIWLNGPAQAVFKGEIDL